MFLNENHDLQKKTLNRKKYEKVIELYVVHT